jgi:GT2 family glycosyltransferase
MPLGDLSFISIITLNYNQTAATCAFLESTRLLDYPNYEILVCDMASASDPSPSIPNGKYPHTNLLKSKKNLGFAGGNNWGMRQAKGEYLFIVNNDTEVTYQPCQTIPRKWRDRRNLSQDQILFHSQCDSVCGF